MTVQRSHPNVALAPEFLKSDGSMYNGSGIFPGNHVDTALDTNTMLTFSLMAQHRQGPFYSENTITLPDGGSWNVNSGTQPGQPTRAEWNWDWSIGVKGGGSLGNVIDSHDIYQQVKYDGLVFETFKLVHVAASGPRDQVDPHGESIYWAKQDTHGNWVPAIVDDGQHSVNGQINVTQNSENLSFFLGDLNNARTIAAEDPTHNTRTPIVDPLTLAQATAHGHSVDVTLYEAPLGTDVSIVGTAANMVEHAHIAF